MLTDFRLRRALHSAGSKVLAKISDDGSLTPAAASKFDKLERQAVELALRAFAFDVRHTAIAIVDLWDRDLREEALDERGALAGRVLTGWALDLAHLPYRNVDLFDLVDPLRIGLGSELKAWLVAPDLSVADVASWIERFGAKIDYFVDYVRRRTNQDGSGG